MTSTTLTRTLRLPSPALVMGAAVSFMLVFSALFLLEKSLRLDETQTLWQTSHSLIGVLKIIAQDVHLPLYFLMLRAWEAVFGANALVIRSFSLLFLVAAVPLFYALAKQAYSRQVAVLVVILVATSPFLLWYGSEGRMYTLLLFFTLVNQLAFLKLRERTSASYWLLYAVASALGALTHYFFFFVLLVQTFFYLTHRHLFPRHTFRNLIGVAIFIMVECAVWFYYRTTVGKINADPFLPTPTSIDVFNIFSNFFLGFQGEYLNSLFLSLWPIFVLFAFTLLKRGRHVSPETTYLLLSALVPIALAFVVSVVVRPMFLSRYLIITLPALYILLAHFLFLYKRQVAYAGAGVLVVGMQAALFLQVLSPNVRIDEKYREAAEYVERRVAPDDLVVASAPFTRYPVEYYYSGDAKLVTFPHWERHLELPAIPPYQEQDLAGAIEEWRGQYTKLYVLTSYDQGYEEELRLYLDHHVERIDAKTFSPGLTLYVYRLRYL